MDSEIIGTFVKGYAYACFALVAVLVIARKWIGQPRAASWLVVLALAMLAIEEPLFTFWLGLAPPQVDHDGMATLITAQARAHVFDTCVYSAALALLLGWIAIGPFRRGERWATRVLGCGWAVAVATEVSSFVLVFSRGLPLPGPGGAAGRDGIGWQPVAVGLLAWAAGLWLHGAIRPPSSAPRASNPVARSGAPG